MLHVLPALLAPLVLIALSAAPASAGVDPVARIDPFAVPDEACVVPASVTAESPCPPLGSPERDGGIACNLPALYLGGRPGPCPDRREPPESRIIPLAPSGLTR